MGGLGTGLSFYGVQAFFVRAWDLSSGTLIFGPIQVLVTRWSSLRGLNYRGFICGISKPYWKLSKCSKRLFITKSSFEKVAASRIVSREFSAISEDSSVLGQLYLKVAAHQLFSCMLKATHLFSLFVYIATLKIFRIILSVVFALLKTALFALVS